MPWYQYIPLVLGVGTFLLIGLLLAHTLLSKLDAEVAEANGLSDLLKSLFDRTFPALLLGAAVLLSWRLGVKKATTPPAENLGIGTLVFGGAIFASWHLTFLFVRLFAEDDPQVGIDAWSRATGSVPRILATLATLAVLVGSFILTS